MGNFVSQYEESDSEVEVEYDNGIVESEEENDPFDLQSIPRNLFHRIVDKMNYTDYQQLEETSRFCADACNSTKFKLFHHVPTIYVNKKTIKISEDLYYFVYEHRKRVSYQLAALSAARIQTDSICIYHRITGARLRNVTKQFEMNKTRADALFLTEHIIFEPEDLARFVATLNISYLDCNQFLKREFFQQESIQKIESLTLRNCGLTDDEFINMKTNLMLLGSDAITARGINNFLQQWKRGEREINSVHIQYDTSFNTRNFDVILEGLDANPIWTPQLHDLSVVSKIRVEDYYPSQSNDPPHIYSLFRSDSINKFLIIQLAMSYFEVTGGYFSEAEYIFSFLDNDQYYLCSDRCNYCDAQYCIHRKKYSVRIVKASLPRIWTGLMLATKAATYMAFVIRGFQIILEGTKPAKLVDFNDFCRMLYDENVRTRREMHWIELRLLFFNL